MIGSVRGGRKGPSDENRDTMAEQSGRAELEGIIEKVSGHIGRLMSRWPMVETAIEQSVWTIRSHGFDRQYPKKNEDKLEYIKAFLKQGFVPLELRDRGLVLVSVTKGVLKTRNIIAHSYISGVDSGTTDVLFTRIWIKNQMRIILSEPKLRKGK
jgi:hypothetical protein